MADQNTGNVPQIDPDTIAKIAALAARNGGSQPPTGASPAPAPNFSNMAASAWSNPYATAVPSPQTGVIDPTQHPTLAKIINTLAAAAQAYGWTAMDPRERMQRQEMDAQKAEAMARLGMQGQELGLRGREVDISQQRANTEATGVAQTGAYQKGELEQSGKRTAIEQQRLDQEIKAHQDSVTQAGNTLNELKREHDLAHGDRQAQNRIEQQANAIRSQQQKDEADFHRKSIEAQGLKDTYQGFEDERNRRVQTELEAFKTHSWVYGGAGGPFTASGKLRENVDKINAEIDAREKAAGVATGMKAAGAAGGDTVTVISNGVRGTMPRANLAEAQKRDPKLQVVQ